MNKINWMEFYNKIVDAKLAYKNRNRWSYTEWN